MNVKNNDDIIKKQLVRDGLQSDSDEGYTLRSESDGDNMSVVNDERERQQQHGDDDDDLNLNQQCSESGIALYSYIDDDNDSYNSDCQQSEQKQQDIINKHNVNNNNQKNPIPKQQYQSRIQIADQDEEQTLIDFTPTHNFSNLQSQQVQGNKSKQKNYVNDKQINGMQRQDFSYNDTLSYLEDMVGSTFLDGLTKSPPPQCLPPKIQCTAGYIKQQQPLPSKRKTNNLNINNNPAQQTQLTTKSNLKDENLQTKDQLRVLQKSKSPNNNVIDKTNGDINNKNVKKQYAQQRLQQNNNNRPTQNVNILESQGQRPLKKRLMQSKIVDVNLNKQMFTNKFIHSQNISNTNRSISIHKSKPNPLNQQPIPARKFLQDEAITKQPIKKDIILQKKYNRKQKKVYVQKQKLINNHKQVNGWFYPDRGNVMYDMKVRPWVLQGQLTQQEQYYEGLIKKEYITQLERQSLESYLIRKSSMFTPPPYLAPFGGVVDHTGIATTSYFDHSSNYPHYHHPHVQPQQHYIPYPQQPPHMITNAYTQTASDKLYKNISSFLYSHNNNNNSSHSNSIHQYQHQPHQQSNSSMSTKTMPIRDNNLNGNNDGYGSNDRSHQHYQQRHQQHQHSHMQKQQRRQQKQRQKPAKRQNYVTTNAQKQSVKHNKPQKYQKVLPPNILQTLKSSPFQQPPSKDIGLIKQMSKPNNKSQVFVIYDVPVVVSNQHINTISADVFLLPYCKAMLIDKCPSKWIKCLQKMTGINILQKLQLMNEKQRQLKGQQIPDGSLNRIRVNQSSCQKLNFNTLYLVKLTTLIDQGSKNPFGQRLLKDVIDKVIQSLVSGILNRRSTGKTQTSLLIHGGFFPGIKREDTPRLISYFLSIALANASLEYKRSGAKPKKIIIHVTKQEEYQVYTKQMRKIMLEYRKLQNF